MRLIKSNVLLRQFLLGITLVLSGFLLVRAVHAQNAFVTQEITKWPRPHPEGAAEVKQYLPEITSNGTGFLAAWYESYLIDSTIYTPVYTAMFSESGEVLDPDGILIDNDTISYNTDQEPALLAVDGDYWVLYGYYGLIENLYAGVVNSDGKVTGTFPVGSANNLATITGLAAAYNGENVMAIWRQATLGIYYSLLKPDGNVLIESKILVSDKDLDDRIGISASGSNFLVVYHHNNNLFDGTSSLRFVRVDSNGNILDTQPLVIASYEVFDQSTFDVIPYQGGWLVVYYQDDEVLDGNDNGMLHVKIISADGVVSKILFSLANPIPLNFGGFLEHYVSIQQTKDGFLIAWSVFHELENEQSTIVINTDREGVVISQDIVDEIYQGSPMDVALNNSGTAVALWSRGSETDNFKTRKLIGGRYIPPEGKPKGGGSNNNGSSGADPGSNTGEGNNGGGTQVPGSESTNDSGNPGTGTDTGEGNSGDNPQGSDTGTNTGSGNTGDNTQEPASAGTAGASGGCSLVPSREIRR